MDSKKPVRNGTRARRAALVAAAAATAIWSGGALGRTQTDGPDCDRNPAASLQALNPPIEVLVLKPVDHVPTDSDVSEISDIDLENVAGDTGTPLLKLEPQVSEALREIFDAEQDAGTPEIATSPVADYEDVKNLSELNEDAAPGDAEVEENELSLLRRQMYRIDI